MLMQNQVSPLLTLTSDFGTQDAYVAAMKGTILRINPSVQMVDITHEIAPQDIMEAAFVLRDVVPYFPAGTTHLVVVDPGVGTERRPVAVLSGGHRFVGPDNGIFSLLLADGEPDMAVVLDRKSCWLTENPNNTFHGRDIFAPVAAHLASGLSLTEVGTLIDSLTRLRWAQPLIDQEGMQGWVVHIDRFGNSISNISSSCFNEAARGRCFKCYVGNTILNALSTTFADVSSGEPLIFFGNSGFLEIAVSSGNASELLGIRKGAPVNVVFS